MKHKLSLRLILVAILVLLVLNLANIFRPVRQSRIENRFPLRILLAPSLYMNNLLSGAAEAAAKYLRAGKVYEDINRERSAAAATRAENMVLKARLEELERQLGLEKYVRKYPFTVDVTTVTGRNPMFWHQYLFVEGGRDREFAEGMPVITKDGLVGKITEVFDRRSRIMLLTGPDFSVDVRGERSHILALAAGLGTSVMKINYVPKFEEMQAGEILTTSGLDGSFPEGIPVGYLVEINKPFGDYFLDAYVIPVVDVLKLREVMVVKSFRRKQ